MKIQGKFWLAYPEPRCPQLNSFLLKMDEEAAGGVNKTLYEARRERHRYYFSDLVDQPESLGGIRHPRSRRIGERQGRD